MEAGVGPGTAEEISAQLARILRADGFSKSPSLVRFLTFLVDRALSGGSENVKEYQLGTDVFQRGDDFDPRIDNIVRVQARNLRARLEEYFRNPAAEDTVRFVLPKGGYVLQFEPIENNAALLSTSAEVAVDDDPGGPLPDGRGSVTPANRTHGRIAAILIGIAILLIGTIALAIRSAKHPAKNTTPARSTGDSTLIVAPFANLSADPDNDYFASGLTEELTGALAELPGLRVVARTQSSRWKDRELDLSSLRGLEIDHVIQGSVRKQGKAVRISVRLIDVASGAHLWSHDYDREVRDSLATEREIATAVAAMLKLRLTAGSQVATTKPVNPDAYELYLKGRYSWHMTAPDSAARGIRFLERSIEIDPAFAPAYVALAGCYGTQGIYYTISEADAYAKMRDLTLKALQIDDTLAEAHTLLAGPYAWNDWNWNRAELEYRAGIQLAPQSVIAHQYYASMLGALGRAPEAEKEMREAMRLDPLDSLVQWGEAQLMHWRGENREAEAMLKSIQRQEPDFGLTAQLLAEVEWELGKMPEAEAVLRAHLAKHPQDPIPLGELGYTLAKTNRVAEARTILAQLESMSSNEAFPSHAIANVYLGIGDEEKAIAALQSALDRKALRAPWLKAEPVYRSLDANPGFIELLKRANLD